MRARAISRRLANGLCDRVRYYIVSRRRFRNVRRRRDFDVPQAGPVTSRKERNNKREENNLN